MLKDKIALITGSSRGIGLAIAELLAKNGCHIILNGNGDASKLEQLANSLQKKYGVECTAISASFADQKQISECYQQIYKKYKRLDVVVNNAGMLADALLGMIPESLINDAFDLNTKGVIFSTQAASRIMSKQKSGSIINISSIIGTNGNEGQVVYSATKSAVIGITRASAKELAPKNIRVNAIAPGFIDTNMIKALTPEKHAERIKSIKMGRVGTTEDVAKVALFFASDLSEYVTGQVIGVDGGMLI